MPKSLTSSGSRGAASAGALRASGANLVCAPVPRLPSGQSGMSLTRRSVEVAGTHGPEWCVHLDSPVEARNGGSGDAPGLHHGPATVAPAPDLAGLVALVDRLQTENRQLAEAAAVWQER